MSYNVHRKRVVFAHTTTPHHNTVTANARVLHEYDPSAERCLHKRGRGGDRRVQINKIYQNEDAPRRGSFVERLAYKSTGTRLTPDMYASDFLRTGYRNLISSL